MKKILFAVTTDLNYDQRMQRICNSLQGAGYQVTLVGREWPVSKPLSAQPYQQHRLRCFFNKGKLFYLEYNLRLALYLLKRQDNGYCAVDLDTALPMYGKARWSGSTFIYDAHEYFPETPEVVQRPVVKKLWEWVEAFIVRRTRHAYTVSTSLAQLFGQKYGTPFTVVRNLPLLQPGLPEPRAGQVPYILYQGAVNAGRGLEALLQAMPQIPLRLMICGEGDLLGDLKKLSVELGLGDKVIFKGYVLPEDLVPITRSAYLGIMLLANQGKSYYYSLANKFFDYVQAGVPQLLPDFPEYRALNQQYPVGLFCNLDPDEIARHINGLIRDQDRYAALRGQCCRARRVWNWQEEEKILLEFYGQLWR